MRTYDGHVFWIFGLSGAGKSTLASGLIDDLRRRNVPVLPIDGDVVRRGLSLGLGFSDTDRTENLRRAAEVARLGADAGLCVVASFITPLESQRQLIGEIVTTDRLSMIFADAALEVCRQRDVKKLYARAAAGEVQHMTGIGSAFEIPTRTHLTLATATTAPSVSIQLLIDFVWGRLRQKG
jgi:adenylylsulfate kinase